MSLRRLPFTLAVLALLGVGCSAVTPAAAVVNGRKISESEVQEEVDRVRDDPNFRELLSQQGDEVRGQARRNVLSTFIRVVVIREEATSMGIGVTGAEVTDFLREVEAQIGGPERFAELLERNKLTRTRARVLAERQIFEQELQKAVTKDLAVDQAQVQAVYEQNAAAFTELHLSRITVASQEEGKQVADQATAGADFADLARRRSKDTAAASGGDLGYVDASTLDRGLAAQLGTVAVGGVAGPFPGRAGFEVYKVLDRRTKPLDSVRDQIVDQLLQRDRQSAFDRWLAARLRKARILVNPKYGRFDPESQTVLPGSGKLPE